jgi:hypothetical protein
VLGTQETFCIIIAGLFERDSFDLFPPEFDKPWVIHLRETCCCSTNLYTWRPNTVYKDRSMRRHHNASCPIILGRPFLRTGGAIIDMMEGTIKYQFPLKKGMEHFPRKRKKLLFDSILRANYELDASSLDIT